MKRLLVPVDFSTHTGISCRYAFALADGHTAEIILFHSFFDQLYFSDGGFSTSFESGIMLTDEIILDFYKQKETRLNEIAAELRSLPSIHNTKLEITCYMESGDPEVQIMNAIKLYKPDMIVMGSSGMGKKGLFSGSVARRIIDNSNIPVIAVPEMVGLSTVKNVVYMTTFIPEDCQAILEIDRVLSPHQVNIFCLHLQENETDDDVDLKIKKLSEDRALVDLAKRISYHALGYQNQREILRSFMNQQKIDLIAFIPHKRNILKNIFHQGITKEDLFLTQIPIMAIKPSIQHVNQTDG